MQLWTWHTDRIEAVMTTAIEDDRLLLVTMAGKNMKDWIRELPTIEEWARNNGCNSVAIHGRRGWARALGYEIAGRDELNLHIMRKQL